MNGLNWTPISIESLAIAILLFITSYIGYNTYRTHKTRSIIYFTLTMISFGISFLFSGIADLYLEPIWYQAHTISFIPVALFIVLTVDYTLKEQYSLIGLIPTTILGSITTYLAFQPGSIISTIEGGYAVVAWAGSMVIPGFLIQLLIFLYFMYWALEIVRNAPYEIKSEAILFFLVFIFLGPIEMAVYLIQLWIPILIILADVIVAVSLLLLMILIRSQPKLLFVLPFIPHRILVKNNAGILLFEHNWSKSQFNEVGFSEFVGSIEEIRKNFSDIVFPIDIPLKDGLLILHESKYILIGLVVSNSSKFLRDLVKRFAKEFESQFTSPLQAGETDPVKFDGVEAIFTRYFSIFPSRIIRDEKQQMFIAKKFLELPPEVESKMLEVMPKEDFDAIKCDIQRSDVEVPKEFIDLYEDIIKEMEQAEEEQKKK